MPIPGRVQSKPQMGGRTAKEDRSTWQQAGRLHACEYGSERFMQEVEEATPLFVTSGDPGPHSFVVALPRFAACALRDASVDYAVTHLLFGRVVCRLDAGCKHETEVVLRHVVGSTIDKLHDQKTLGQVRGFLGIWRFPDDFQKPIAMRDHRTVKTGVRHLVTTVPSRKHAPRTIQQLLGPGFGFLVRVFQQKANVANQMSPTVLGFHVEVPSEGTVGREVVEVNVTVHGQRPWMVTLVLTHNHNLNRNRNRDPASTSMKSRTDLALRLRELRSWL